MKDAIKQAIERGWLYHDGVDSIDIENIEYRDTFFEFGFKLKKFAAQSALDYKEMSYYQLIFGTDFIDRLIGDKETSIEHYACRHRGASLSDTENCQFMCESTCLDDERTVNTECGYKSPSQCGSFLQLEYVTTVNASYHLQQMAKPAISRDVEKLKEYIRGLV